MSNRAATVCTACGTRTIFRGHLCYQCHNTRVDDHESPRVLTGGQWVKQAHGIHTWTPEGAA